MRRSTILALLLLTVATPAVGGKPAPVTPPSTTDPQVGYIHTLSNGTREIQLANEDGTGAATLASARVAIGGLSLAPRAQHQLTYVVGTIIHLLTFEISSTGPKTTSDVVVASVASARTVSKLRFSPTGAYIAWVNEDDTNIYIYDLASGQARLLVDTPGDWSNSGVVDIDFTRDGTQLIYSLPPPQGPLTAIQFKSVPVAGGASTDLATAPGPYGYLTVGNTDDRMVTDNVADYGGMMTLFPSVGSSPVTLTTGYHPSLRCDDRVIIFQRRQVSKGGSATIQVLKYDLGTGLTSTFSNSGNSWADYFPDC
jgi:Tol biopolymer transport system component